MFRKIACFSLRRLTNLPLEEIGEILQMTYHNVSLTARRFATELEESAEYRSPGEDCRQN